MVETVIRLKPTDSSRRALYARSSNRCAFTSCKQPIVNDHGGLLGEICHIEAAMPGGPRFNSRQSNEDRRHFSNLMLLCRNHHRETDDVVRFTAGVLRSMKEQHESKLSFAVIPSAAMVERFVDASIARDIALPMNLGALDLRGIDLPTLLDDCHRLIRAIAELPSLTRSAYAVALTHSYTYRGDLTLFFDPQEIAMRISVTDAAFARHVRTLALRDLVTEPEWEDDAANFRQRGCRSYFRTFDGEDNGAHFLAEARRILGPIGALQDTVETLNFQRLDA